MLTVVTGWTVLGRLTAPRVAPLCAWAQDRPPAADPRAARRHCAPTAAARAIASADRGGERRCGASAGDMQRRVYIARGLPNTHDNMVRFIRAPQEMAPGTAMPDMRVSAADAAAMTAFLHRRE